MDRLESDPEYEAQVRADYRVISDAQNASIDEAYADMLNEVYGGAVPEDIFISHLTPFAFLYGTKAQILALAEYDMVLEVMYNGADPNMTLEEKMLIEKYCDTHNIPPQDRGYWCVEIYGTLGDYTYFRIYPDGAVEPIIVNYRLGDIIILHNPRRVEAISTEDEFFTVNELYAAGELNEYEMRELIPYTALAGDVDEDDVLTVKDATKMQKKLAGMDVEYMIDYYPEEDFYDANDDGRFSIQDATWVQKKVAKIE